MKKGDNIVVCVDRSKGGVQGLAVLKDGRYAGIVRGCLRNEDWIVRVEGYEGLEIFFDKETLVAKTGSNSTGVWIDG